MPAIQPRMNRLTLLTGIALVCLPACNSSVYYTSTGGGGASTETGGNGGNSAGTTSSTDTTSSETTSSTTTTSYVCDEDTTDICYGCSYPSDCTCLGEAPQILPQIAQAAVAQFAATGSLCATALPVPAAVAPDLAYNASPILNSDFHTGDAETGWNCLKFAIDGGIHCRYSYGIQGVYWGPLVGGPDPGMSGFEVSAMADEDGDGSFSTFTITGTLDPQTGTFTLSPLFEHDPTE